MKKLCVLLLLSMASMTISAGVYKWVDENGKTNYGQKIPEQYKNKSESINAEISVFGSVPVKKKDKRISNPYDLYGIDNRKLTNKKRLSFRKKKKRNTKNTSCSARKAEYKKARDCYNACSFSTGTGGTNISSCRCKNVSKPSC